MFMAGLGLRAVISQALFQPFLRKHSFQAPLLLTLEVIQCGHVCPEVGLTDQGSQHWGPWVQGLFPSGVWTGEGSPSSQEAWGLPADGPHCCWLPAFTVNMSFFYHELLTSHLMTIIFIKQPKQRSLALEKSRPYISIMFSFSTSLDKKNRSPQLPQSPTDRWVPHNQSNPKEIMQPGTLPDQGN